jgi:energy-converting hydrogenase Eha subunit C
MNNQYNKMITACFVGYMGDNLKMGVLAGIIFLALLLIGIVLCRQKLSF